MVRSHSPGINTCSSLLSLLSSFSLLTAFGLGQGRTSTCVLAVGFPPLSCKTSIQQDVVLWRIPMGTHA
ncbi:unnamed protein product [Penicillium olsonii]|uniref:Secreted protein n=1 Tax=Penicillium olsonii TaxID=99116 RepID=A0A9W4MLA5_PENOL|nr:unnamed protein product [Penicillium olsonii]CAG8061768.1 unnamed protein product [Penicillium olsonii]